MLFKISLSGVKARWKDYLILFSGMIMTVAIFYMFEAISTNNKFTTATSVGQNAKFVFIFGSILLAIITLVYVFYANSFLMSMRKRDYGLFMMLGAKSSKISFLIIIETLAVGFLSALIGIILGLGLTKAISGLLMNQLQISLKYFTAIYPPAILTTLILFMILFVIAGALNAWTFRRTSALALLHAEDRTAWKKPKSVILWSEAIVGVLLLAGGYYALYQVRSLMLMSIVIGLVTIVLGTYLTFNSFFVMLLEALQKSNFSQKGINEFTIAQLKFRIRDLTKILSVVSLLFALALGAITVGIGFKNSVSKLADANTPYAISTVSQSSKMNLLINKLDDKTVIRYQHKTVGKTIYYRADDFQKAPVKYTHLTQKSSEPIIIKSRLKDLKNPSTSAYQSFSRLQDPKQQSYQLKFVSPAAFNRINRPIQMLTLIHVKNLDAQYRSLKAIYDLQNQELGSNMLLMSGESFMVYMQLNSLFASFEFMGIFLGIAFLAMLASCLMFKILSGAGSDKARFEMLNKIGTRKWLLKKSIMLQILGLFALPAILGLIDVAFGLQLFTRGNLLSNAYQTFSYSAIGFLVVYLIYYAATVLIYTRIVIPKIRAEK